MHLHSLVRVQAADRQLQIHKNSVVQSFKRSSTHRIHRIRARAVAQMPFCADILTRIRHMTVDGKWRLGQPPEGSNHLDQNSSVSKSKDNYFGLNCCLTDPHLNTALEYSLLTQKKESGDRRSTRHKIRTRLGAGGKGRRGFLLKGRRRRRCRSISQLLECSHASLSICSIFIWN